MNPAQHLIATRKGEVLIITENDYDSDGNMIYHGEAERGSATTDSAWIIEKSTWEDGMWVRTRMSKFGVKWTDRTTATYS